MNSFQLLKQRRFGPFFIVQALGVLNDNIFKMAAVILLTSAANSESEAGVVSSLAGGMLILPFLLFSHIAGPLSDKFPKNRVIQSVKAAEIAIVVFGSFAYFQQQPALIYFTLFLLGTHSAFFGPAKFSILPQVMSEDELVAANASVELGTFLSIIGGTILGGSLSRADASYVAGGIVCIALLGFLASLLIPKLSPAAPDLSIHLSPHREFLNLWRLITKTRTLFLSVLGISWFWFVGAIIMSQLPSFVKFVIQGDETVITLLLAVFCVSIGMGSILCERLSGTEIEIGLVPLGAAGISLFMLHFSALEIEQLSSTAASFQTFFEHLPKAGKWILIDLFGMGFSGAFFIIPLNAFLQNRAEPKECSRIIAATNIMNAIFMLAAAGVVILLNAFQLSSQSIFGVVAVLNILVSVYMFSIIPEFTMRFIVWFLASTIYRLKYTNRLALPKHGPAIIVSNHVSYIDWFIIAAACRRPVRFVMYYKFFEAPILNWFFRMGKAIPIASAKENEGIKTKAFSQIQWELGDDNPICIFPEGTLTTTGDLETFRGGVEEIQKQNPGVPVMTLFLHGLWGSYFSRSGGKAMAKLPKPKWRVIEVEFGQTFNNFVSAVELQNYYTKHLKTRVDHQES